MWKGSKLKSFSKSGGGFWANGKFVKFWDKKKLGVLKILIINIYNWECFQPRKKFVFQTLFWTLRRVSWEGKRNLKERQQVKFQRKSLCEWASTNLLVHLYKTKMWYCERFLVLIFADYENVFEYVFDFNSKWADKDLKRNIRLRFNKLSKYKKIPVVYFDYLPPIS